MKKETLSLENRETLISTLKSRFEKNISRHPDVKWSDVLKRLELNEQKLWSLNEMERTGGEPDVTGFDEKTGEFIFTDCSPESPKERRSLCYDREALESRKEFKPKNTVIDMAAVMGIEILDEEQYRNLQLLGPFDTKTSSWLKTPQDVRSLGGAIYGDFRYGRVFVYHNGAESYYNSRAFRGMIRI